MRKIIVILNLFLFVIQVNNKILEFMQNFENIQRTSKLSNNFLGK